MTTGTAAANPASHSDQSLRSRYAEVRQRIADAAAKSGRKASDIVLVAVTKTASMDQIREVVSMGQLDLGENRVQQLMQRAAQMSEFLDRAKSMPSLLGSTGPVPAAVRWHMIGTLQRNKAKKAVETARLIHSVDNLRLAEDLQSASERRTEPTEVLVEVNVSGERSKMGIAPAAAPHLVEMIETMVTVRCRGMMCMAPADAKPEELRGIFERARELFEEIRTGRPRGHRFDILSMGMSNDYETAIECGANLVRVGSAIFGAPAIPEAGDDE
jgi:pyridoxal phosphate enzyme (YggS family)